MKKLLYLFVLIPLLSIAQECKIPKYKVYPTENKEVSLKLDSATGEVWQVKIGIETGEEVATKIDSRTILDENGADKLIGKGDMLYQKPGSPAPVRMHGAFVTLKEIEDLVAHISSQPKPSEVIIETYKEESSSIVDGDGIDDDLLHKAIEIIVMSKQGSISLLQRRLSVGYSRAARLIDEMERLKIVGPFTGSKAREVLVDESYLETINED